MLFRFKQFNIEDDQSTLKVGTDAMLLGAWVNGVSASKILDIGTGCGILALMMAQKSEAQIDAIDIDDNSIVQAKDNFNNSPWPDRLKVKNIALNDFVKVTDRDFDLIICNPPFFEQSLKSASQKNNQAKHQKDLNFLSLLEAVEKLLSDKGRFCVILPYLAFDGFMEIAKTFALFCNRKNVVFPKADKKASRVLLEFRKSFSNMEMEKLILRNANNSYTDEYLELTKSFHQF